MATPFFTWLQGTPVATTISESQMLTAGLSAVHAVGVALVGGGALITLLRLTGVLLPAFATRAIVRPAACALALGVTINIVTGVLMFSTRATATIHNSFFQIKMSLLLLAVGAHASLYRAATDDRSTPTRRRLVGLLIGALWFGVIGAGCALILLE